MKLISRFLPIVAAALLTLGATSCSKEQAAAPAVQSTAISNVNEPRTIFGYAQIAYNTRVRYSYVDNNSATSRSHDWQWILSTDGGTTNLVITPIGTSTNGGTTACYVDAGPAYDGPQGADLVLLDHGVPVASKPIQSGDVSAF